MPNRSKPRTKKKEVAKGPQTVVPRQPKTAEQLREERRTQGIPRASRPRTAKVA